MRRSSIALALASSLSLTFACAQDEGDIQAEPCEMEGEQDECDGGVYYCARDADTFDLEWSACVDPDEVECVPGDSDACVLFSGVPGWLEVEGTTPLVLVFDDAPVTYAAVPASAASFDIDTTGVCGAPAWPTANTPWLALDRDHSGSIEAGHELFGSGSRLANGARAPQGFAALAELDSDGDGRITGADASFADLTLWGDHDADRRSSPWELTDIAAAGILSIDLDYSSDARRCDARGNCEIERASFEYRDRYGVVRSGEVVDIHVICEE
jgi:hypothetical protein